MSDFDIFLSHNSRDTSGVRALAEALRDRGLKVWIDEWELVPGQPWQEALERIIVTIPCTAVLVGKDGLGPWEVPELRGALSEYVKRGMPVIPVLLPGAPATPDLPLFLEQLTWVDLRSGLTEGGVDRLMWGITGRRPTSMPRWISQIAPAPARVATDRLPSSGLHFVAREKELNLLDKAWEDPHCNVVSIVAWGGMGKSALVNRWLARLATDDWRGAEQVFGWTFETQTAEEPPISADLFVNEALHWFGDADPSAGSSRDRGSRLAELVQQKRTLLVLDGVEPLQYPPGPKAGRLKDPALIALAKTLAASNLGMCLITTCEPIADLAQFVPSTTTLLNLEGFEPETGGDLLRCLGVRGSDDDLYVTAKEFGGHPLTLTLLGTYLRKVCDGDVRRRNEVPLTQADAHQGGQAHRLMTAYEHWLDQRPELSILRLMGLFDGPAEKSAITALCEGPVIPGLTENLVQLTGSDWRWSLATIIDTGLLTKSGTNDFSKLHAHPLVREHFRNYLRKYDLAAWHKGNERLHVHFSENELPEPPRTLDDLTPLFAAAIHGCRAGKHQKILDKIYRQKIQGDEYLSTRKFGAFGTELNILAEFFAHTWDSPVAGLDEHSQAFIMNEVGFNLRATGRLEEAIHPMASALRLRVEQKNWRAAATNANNLSELHLLLGDIKHALELAEKGISIANLSNDPKSQVVSQSKLADALHQLGQFEKSAIAFRKAEKLQSDNFPQRSLYSWRGFFYCDLIITQGLPEIPFLLHFRPGAKYPQEAQAACNAVIRRSAEALRIARKDDCLVDLGLSYLASGRAHLGLTLITTSTETRASELSTATKHLNRAVRTLKSGGQEHFVASALIAQAASRRISGDYPEASERLKKAMQIARHGSMLLLRCDAHLESALLHLCTDEVDEAALHLEKSTNIINQTSYHRRDPVVALLEDQIGAYS